MINKLHIHKFRNFTSIEFNFDKTNIIYGDCSTGKTNFCWLFSNMWNILYQRRFFTPVMDESEFTIYLTNNIIWYSCVNIHNRDIEIINNIYKDDKLIFKEYDENIYRNSNIPEFPYEFMKFFEHKYYIYNNKDYINMLSEFDVDNSLRQSIVYEILKLKPNIHIGTIPPSYSTFLSRLKIIKEGHSFNNMILFDNIESDINIYMRDYVMNKLLLSNKQSFVTTKDDRLLDFDGVNVVRL